MRSKRRGSAMLFILMMVFAITAVVLVGAELSMMNIRDQRRYEDRIGAESTFDSIVAKIDADSAKATLVIPDTRTVSLNGYTGTFTTVDNSASIANTYKTTGTLTAPNGRTFPLSAVLPVNVVSMFYYALAVQGAINPKFDLNSGSGGANGDIYSNGAITLGSSSTINGKCITTNATNTGGTVTGTRTASFSPAISFPSISGVNYLAAATSVYLTSQTWNGVTFPSVAAGASYPVLYCAGNLTLSGTITNVGTIYVAGTFNNYADITYANSSSRLAVISPNDFTLDGNDSGYFFTPGQLTFFAGGNTITGSCVAGSLSMKKAATLVSDNAIKGNPSEGVRMHLPGLWP
jgi:hypothetical protein